MGLSGPCCPTWPRINRRPGWTSSLLGKAPARLAVIAATLDHAQRLRRAPQRTRRNTSFFGVLFDRFDRHHVVAEYLLQKYFGGFHCAESFIAGARRGPPEAHGRSLLPDRPSRHTTRGCPKAVRFAPDGIRSRLCQHQCSTCCVRRCGGNRQTFTRGFAAWNAASRKGAQAVLAILGCVDDPKSYPQLEVVVAGRR